MAPHPDTVGGDDGGPGRQRKKNEKYELESHTCYGYTGADDRCYGVLKAVVDVFVQMNSETITKSDQRDIISKLPPHTLLWLEARMQLVRNDGISRRSSTHDNQKHLNDRSENTSVSSQSPQDNRRWKETGKPTATEDEYEAPKRLRNMEDIAANETPTERQSTATILRNGVANVVKELKDPEFWSEFSDGAETALKGQYVFIKTTLLTVAALSPVSETFRFTLRTFGNTYSKIRNMLFPGD